MRETIPAPLKPYEMYSKLNSIVQSRQDYIENRKLSLLQCRNVLIDPEVLTYAADSEPLGARSYLGPAYEKIGYYFIHYKFINF